MLLQPVRVYAGGDCLHRFFDPLGVINGNGGREVGQHVRRLIGIGIRAQYRQTRFQRPVAEINHTLIRHQAAGKHQAGQRHSVQRGNGRGHHNVLPIARCHQQGAGSQSLGHIPNASGTQRHLLDPPRVHLALIENR